MKLSQREENWKCLLKVFSTIRKMGRQGLALRGDNKEGNFIQILKLLAEDDKSFSEWIDKGSYISPDIQNEILEMLAHTILREVTAQIRKSNFFAILLDETRDWLKTLCILVPRSF